MQKCNENAANRYSYVGEVYSFGERAKKKEILSALPKEWRELHEKGFIHIHDLDAYGLTYNCLTFDILRDFPYERFVGMSQTRKIIATFEYLKNLFCDIVKVDREFVKNIIDSEFDRELVKYTVTLCHSLGIHVCIEGVEEKNVYDIVSGDCSADYIQGYLFGRPISESDFEEQYLIKEILEYRDVKNEKF